MRAVNLIPSEQRRGEAAPMRTGPLAYLLVGALALLLVAVTAVTVLGNSLGEKENDLAAASERQAEAEARAAALQPFVEFEALKQARVSTISKLAVSRFDWERVMNELALVLPKRVWLTGLRGTVVPDGEGAAGISGPSLELSGCARSQRDIARLVTSLEDIDGATRTYVPSGTKAGAGAEGGSGCQTRDFVALFEATVAFDEVEIDESLVPPVSPEMPEPDPPAAGTGTPDLASAGENGVGSSDDAATPGVDGAPAPEGDPPSGAESVAEAEGKVSKAKNLAAGGGK